MKNIPLYGKITSALKVLKVGRSASGAGSSLLKEPAKGKSYANKYTGSGVRKKSILEKLRAKRERQVQYKTILSKGKKPGSLKRFPLAVALVFGGLLLGGYLLLTGPVQKLYSNMQYFRISEIEISGCVITKPFELRKFAGISFELNMLTLNPGLIQERLKEHPWVAEANVRRIWPDKISLVVNEYRPRALLVQDDGEDFEYVDRKGTVFAKVLPGQDIDFAVITGLSAFDTMAERRELLDVAMEVLDDAARNNPNLPAQNISEIHFNSEGDLTLHMADYPFPILLGKGEIKWKCYQLRKVLQSLYRKKRDGADIENVAYIKMDYQKHQVLVVNNQAG